VSVYVWGILACVCVCLCVYGICQRVCVSVVLSLSMPECMMAVCKNEWNKSQSLG